MVLSKNHDGGKDGIVVYSLGNFVSNQRRAKTDGGAIVKIEMSLSNDKYIISDAGYILTWVYTPIEKYRKKYFILPASSFESRASFFTNPSDYVKMKTFLKGSRELLNKQNTGIKEYIF